MKVGGKLQCEIFKLGVPFLGLVGETEWFQPGTTAQ